MLAATTSRLGRKNEADVQIEMAHLTPSKGGGGGGGPKIIVEAHDSKENLVSTVRNFAAGPTT